MNLFPFRFGATRGRPARRDPQNRARPRLEVLEDRLNLSPMTFIVTRGDDPTGAHVGMSLRDAVTAADTNAGADTIKFASTLAGHTIKLDPTQGELQISESVTIQGLGASKLTIDGGAVNRVGGTRIFDLFGGEASPNHVTISGLTLQNGNYQTVFNPEVDGGGAIGALDFGINFIGPSQADSLTVQGCVLRNNTTDGVGGAIAVTGGNLTIQDSTITNNVSGNEGGGISFDDAGNTVHLRMDRDTVSNNRARFEQGGGLSIQGGDANIINACTFSGNVSGGEGGAIANRPTGGEIPVPTNSANTVIQNTTIFGNSAGRDGGGIWNADSILTLRNDTIDQNHTTGSGGGVFNEGGLTDILNTIVAGDRDQTGANDIASADAAIFNAQYSLIQAAALGSINGTNSHDIFGRDPHLGPLQFNGGPTMTQALLAGSAAINTGSNALAAGLSTDQTGKPRIIGGTVDIGAFEYQPPAPPLTVRRMGGLVLPQAPPPAGNSRSGGH